MSVNKVVVGALLGALVGYCGIASARYVESDPVGLTGGINTYAYAGGNPISNFDPSGLYCTSAGGMTTCSYPGGPSFRLPTPQGFPAEINASMRALYHKYDVQQALGCVDPQDMLQALINSPTPGTPMPATPNGTPNNAVVFGQDNWVNSYLTTDLNTGAPVVVNITGPNSLFFPGYVARTVSNGIAHTYGEGLNPYQSPSVTAGWLQDIANALVWGQQMKQMANKCGCKH